MKRKSIDIDKKKNIIPLRDTGMSLDEISRHCIR
jgi:hypothetical protein